MKLLASLAFAIIGTLLIIYWERKAKREREDMYNEQNWFK